MKFTSLVFSLLFVVFQGNGQSSQIIMSTIGTQEVYEGARITTYFSTLKHFETIEFSSVDMPAFATLMNDGEGSGRFVFDPEASDIGEYTITLDTESEGLSTQSIFKLEVKAIPADATIYYVDPINGNMDNPGTAAEPFPGLTAVFVNHLAQLNGNTFFYLRNGYHGAPSFQGNYDNPVYVVAERNHSPAVKNLSFFLTINWYVSGLDVSPETNNETSTADLVNVSGGSKKIVLTNCKIYSIEDASVWTTNDDWYAACADGIISSGKECLFKNNYIKNTWFSVELWKRDNEFSYNIINWFGADAIRALANDQKVNYNQIKNATVFDYYHPTEPQHDDGIQSWTSNVNVAVKNLQIIGNQIVDIADPNLPMPTEIMQGIVDFDGFAEDWVVENNLVITHHPHGIALYGAKNCKVTNNTVVRNPLNYYSSSTKPWIRINPRKEDVGGDLSTGNLVRNNIMASYQDDGKEPATVDHNILGIGYSSYFEDYDGWNFNLSATSPAIDAGYEEDAPFIDLHQKRRNVGAVDAGCFEREATLEDRETPSAPTNIDAVQITKTSMTLEWTEGGDNTAVAYYEVKVDGQALCTVSPTVFIAGLNPNTTYDITVKTVDYFNNLSLEATYTASTIALEMLSIYFVPVDRHDQLIKSNAKLMWAGMPLHRVGGYFDNQDASAVLPFKLPCLDNREIISADFIVNVNDVINTPDANVDLYGLGYDENSCVSGSYHWQGAFGEDTDATPIAEAYITSLADGMVTMATEEKMVMGAYLQGLYDDGLGCDDFTFFRLNIGATEIQDNAYYEIDAAEGKNSFKTPLLSIITNGTVGVRAVEVESGITISPNPSNGKNIKINIEGFEESSATLVMHNAKGQEVFRENLDNISNELTLDIKTDLVTGTYFVTILGQQQYAQTRLIVVK